MKALLLIFGGKNKTFSISVHATKVGRAGTTCEVAAAGSATHTCPVQLGHGGTGGPCVVSPLAACLTFSNFGLKSIPTSNVKWSS